MRTCVALIVLALGVCLYAADQAGLSGGSASDLYEKGRAAEKAGHVVDAYLFYAQAFGLDPTNRTYWQHMQSVQKRAEAEGQVHDTAADLAGGLPAHPAYANATAQDRLEARQPLPPTELEAAGGRQDFDLRGDSRQLFEEVAHAFGLDCVFDGDYTAVPAFRFRLTDADYRTALHALEASTTSFLVPLTSKLFLVVHDTAQKRTDLEPHVAVSIHIPEVLTAQDFNAMVTAVQQTFAIEKVGFDSQTHMAILKGAISKVIPARAMFEDLLVPRSQVMVDVKLVELSRNDTITYGLNFPTLLSITPLTTWLNNPTSLASGLSGLLTFGAGKTLVGLGITTPSLVAQMSDSVGKTLLTTELPGISGVAATLHVGDRYPIATAGYFGNLGESSTSTGGIGNSGINAGTGTNTGSASAGTLQLSENSVTWAYTAGGDAPQICEHHSGEHEQHCGLCRYGGEFQPVADGEQRPDRLRKPAHHPDHCARPDAHVPGHGHLPGGSGGERVGRLGGVHQREPGGERRRAGPGDFTCFGQPDQLGGRPGSAAGGGGHQQPGGQPDGQCLRLRPGGFGPQFQRHRQYTCDSSPCWAIRPGFRRRSTRGC